MQFFLCVLFLRLNILTFLGPLRPTVSQFPSSSSSSAASDSAFASSELQSSDTYGVGSHVQSPPYDDVLPDRHLYAFTRRSAAASTTTTTTTTLPGGGTSSSGSNFPTSLTSSKSSLYSRASSLNSLGVIDEATPTPSQLASARQSTTDRSERSESPYVNGEIMLNGSNPSLVRRNSSSNRKKIFPIKNKLPDYNEYLQDSSRLQQNGYTRRSSSENGLEAVPDQPRHRLYEKKVSEVIMM